ncbi:hypothetical protein YC2023_005628 [Brassica napus]
MQNINLGAEDPPVQLPANVVNEAAAGNRFVLIGRPTIPRRQNIRSIIATLPRNWGHVGVYGRLVEGRRFQFVFPSEEALEMVLRRGPWAFADRMLILERWTPNFNPLMLNFIPFWIQIRGIPFQFMSQDVVIHIGRALGMYIEVDYNADAAARRDYARVRVNWDVDEPLRFQRQFQFTAGINTLLRLTYERLRGFCEICGSLTHDSGACLIQNGGIPQDGGDDDSEGDNDEDQPAVNHGVIIEEVNEDERNEAVDVEQEGIGNVQEEQVEGREDLIEEAEEEDDLWNGHTLPNLYSDELNTEEMFNPINPFVDGYDGREGLKRKAWMAEADHNKSKFSSVEQGESSGARSVKRKTRGDVTLEETTFSAATEDEADTTVGGAIDFLNYVSVPPIGSSGGLVIFWKQHVQFSVLSLSPNLVDCKVDGNEGAVYTVAVSSEDQ